jgi:hypothetical protein
VNTLIICGRVCRLLSLRPPGASALDGGWLVVVVVVTVVEVVAVSGAGSCARTTLFALNINAHAAISPALR